MLVAEGRVETERASRYLVQLCRHVHLAAQHNHGMQAQVDWSVDRGMISFGWGRCTLRADPAALALRAEAPTRNACTSFNSASPTAWGRWAGTTG
jgi:hypothetical protein